LKSPLNNSLVDSTFWKTDIAQPIMKYTAFNGTQRFTAPFKSAHIPSRASAHRPISLESILIFSEIKFMIDFLSMPYQIFQN
jgi:hypothetical protein